MSRSPGRRTPVFSTKRTRYPCAARATAISWCPCQRGTQSMDEKQITSRHPLVLPGAFMCRRRMDRSRPAGSPFYREGSAIVWLLLASDTLTSLPGSYVLAHEALHRCQLEIEARHLPDHGLVREIRAYHLLAALGQGRGSRGVREESRDCFAQRL